MKQIRVIFSLVVVVAIFLASTVLPVNAIGFEAEEAYESVFVIYSGNSLGSGFAIGENCIVTNAHVIENPRDITVETYGGTKYEASVVGINEHEDIAVLIVQNAVFPYLEIADLATMKTGDDIYAIGAPNGMAYTLTKGGISAKERAIGNQTYIQIDAPINHGNSGGPLLNDAGQVLGMNTLKMSDSEGIGLAIPITRICDYLTSLDIKLNSNGNVAEVIEPSKPSEQPAQNESRPDTERNTADEDQEDTSRAKSSLTYIVAFIAFLSLVANGILAICLINEKKKNATLQYDPSERTDFDIDILE